MRLRPVAIAVLVTFAALTAVDVVWCADGCRDAADRGVSSVPHGDRVINGCPWCLGGLNTPDLAAPAPPASAPDALGDARPARIPPAPVTSIEHPPRAS